MIFYSYVIIFYSYIIFIILQRIAIDSVSDLISFKIVFPAFLYICRFFFYP